VEAWTIVEEAYVDGGFGGNNWERELSSSLLSAYTSTDGEAAYSVVKEMVEKLGDPFTRLVPPQWVPQQIVFWVPMHVGKAESTFTWQFLFLEQYAYSCILCSHTHTHTHRKREREREGGCRLPFTCPSHHSGFPTRSVSGCMRLHFLNFTARVAH
jgi:hypothetical protein